MENNDIRKCKNCDHVVHGRSDKQFCNDFCRNAFNNKLNAASNNLVRNIDHILHKNRRILQQLWNRKPPTCRITEKEILRTGFDFSYFTQAWKSDDGKEHFSCYEYGYHREKDDLFIISHHIN